MLKLKVHVLAMEYKVKSFLKLINKGLRRLLRQIQCRGYNSRLRGNYKIFVEGLKNKFI